MLSSQLLFIYTLHLETAALNQSASQVTKRLQQDQRVNEVCLQYVRLKPAQKHGTLEGESKTADELSCRDLNTSGCVEHSELLH